MQQILILLTGDIEAEFLGGILLRQSPSLTIHKAQTPDELTKIVDGLSSEESETARLIAFCTNSIVPREVLGKLKQTAYNFHPAPPQYPGSKCANFAAADKATSYGITLHEMTAKVDEGTIIDTRQFDMNEDATVDDFETTAYQALVQLFIDYVPELIETSKPLSVKTDANWSGIKRSAQDLGAS